MKHKLLSLLLSCVAVGVAQLPLAAQTVTTLGAYTEPFDETVVGADEWAKLADGPQLSWGSRDVHYGQRQVPSLNIKADTTVYAWRGERVGMQAVVFSKTAEGPLALSVSKADGLDATAGFVNYVKSDGYRGCKTNPMNSAVEMVPDVIDNQPTKSLKARSVSPLWLTIEVSPTATAGERTLTLDVTDTSTGAVVGTLRLKVNVVDRTLPAPKDYVFNTNFWQQPYAIARYHGVTPWSQAHYDALRSYLQLLARCGQKSVTAFIIYQPWGDSNVVDIYNEMIRPTKKSDGTWVYDYSIFDHYVALCDSCGINGQINCFTMVPWDMNFRYYDEAGNVRHTGQCNIGDATFSEYWTPFLQSFAQHLKEKGWFEKTYISMDERGEAIMKSACDFVERTVPGMRMALAADSHISSMMSRIYDYCLTIRAPFTAAELKARKDSGFVSTIYTACPDIAPNMQAYNDPADVAYLPLHATALGLDGYLHWAIFHWPENPLVDTRFKTFSPGDTYSMYPGPRSSVRYERYIEGVEQAEKVRILREDNTLPQAKRDSLEEQVRKMTTTTLTFASSSSRMVNVLEAILNDSPMPGIEPAANYCSTSLQSTNKATAVAQRWLTSANVSGDAVSEDVEMTWSAPSADGYVMAPETVTLKPGKSATFRLVASEQSDGLQWCRASFFADWDGDKNFGSRDDELVNTTGTARQSNANVKTYVVTVNVPADAKTGKTLRLRAVYNDAWGDVPQACGELMKGFCIDFPVTIEDNSANGITTPRSANGGNAVTLTWTAGGFTADGKVKVAVYNMQGMLIDSVEGVTSYSTARFTPGAYVMRVADEQGNIAERKFLK